MSAWTRLPSCLKELLDDNPQADVTDASRHWEIRVNGKMVGIYPRTPAKEGFAHNTKAQLRRAGLIVEGR